MSNFNYIKFSCYDDNLLNSEMVVNELIIRYLSLAILNLPIDIKKIFL